MTLWVQLSFDESEAYEIDYRVLGDDNALVEMSGFLEVVNHDVPATVTLPSVDIHLPGPLVLKFQIKEKGKRWKTAVEMPVRLPAETSSVSGK